VPVIVVTDACRSTRCDAVRVHPSSQHKRRSRVAEIVRIAVGGRFTVNDGPAALTVCADGFGIPQFVDFVVSDLLRSKVLVEVFPDWAEARYPVYLLYPSRHLPPAKLRAFADFLVSSTR
jgi:DNA-binding transcriptional LysR family regulator